MKQLIILLVCANVVSGVASASDKTIGPDGINSKVTGLDGGGDFPINIGMVEAFRSGKAGYDSEDWSAPNTVPYGVYQQGFGGMSAPNQNIDLHATEVAGVMIGDGGVAPMARLHSIGVDLGDIESLIGVAAQRLAAMPVTPGMVAINMSINRPPDFFRGDGRDTLSQFVDWSAVAHDVLYVTVSPNWDSPGETVPGDNFNGITVAASNLGTDGMRYSEFAGANDWPSVFGDRTYIDILAPGEGIAVMGLTRQEIERGTSFAAPHVTGTVALMHQYFEGFRLPGIFHHTLAKAILLNSADKLSGVHGSERTIKNHAGLDWRDSPAASSWDIPLDLSMGAGHLNAANAISQLAAGGYSFEGNIVVPLKGWARDTVNPGGDVQYRFVADAAGWVAVTLCWDRIVQHTGGHTFGYGDTFFPYGESVERLNDLDLYLLTLDNQIVDASISLEHTEEHIFVQVPAGAYKIVVAHTGNGIGDFQQYSLAWWADSAVSYEAWREQFGAVVPTGTNGDFNSDGIVDAADYVVWRKGQAGLTSVAIPEPSTLILAAIIFLPLRIRSQKRTPQ